MSPLASPGLGGQGRTQHAIPICSPHACIHAACMTVREGSLQPLPCMHGIELIVTHSLCARPALQVYLRAARCECAGCATPPLPSPCHHDAIVPCHTGHATLVGHAPIQHAPPHPPIRVAVATPRCTPHHATPCCACLHMSPQDEACMLSGCAACSAGHAVLPLAETHAAPAMPLGMC